MNDFQWMEIGTIVAPQGLNGSVRVYPSTDFPERFLQPGQRWLQYNKSDEPQPIQLVKGKYLPNKKLFVVQFANVNNREEAEKLRGCLLLVPKSDRPKLNPGEYHIQDLIGLPVFNLLTGSIIGSIIDVIIIADNYILQVQEETTGGTEGTEGAKTTEDTEGAERRKKKVNKKVKVKSKIVLIPFVEEIVPIVDLKIRRVEVLPPPGLLELN
ncbi:MAG TPA: ribosome maturation factor RimM [Oscillatoriaceae cyanobacterium M7585_C2015_266]|nr:ribosome maturation factor RimM [Oscillatoriaceae cyanobacterium M7585_C2015_266]